MIDGKYQDAAYDAVANGGEFVTTARIVTPGGALVTALDLTGGSCTFDEEWSPYVQAQLTAADPGVLLDPRLSYRLIIDAGYVYPSGQRDVVQLADLFLTDYDLDHRNQVVSLVAASDEVIAQTTSHFSIADDVLTYASYYAAMVNFVTRALTAIHVPTFVNGLGAGTGASMTNYTIRVGDLWWSHIQSVRDMAGAEIYCDENRTWQIRDFTEDSTPVIWGYPCTGDMPHGWPGIAGAAVLPIISEADTSISRDTWANAVALLHTYPGAGGTTVRVAGIAQQTTGPFSTSAVGFKVLKQERTVPATSAELSAACASILLRSNQRGERMTMTLRAMYWMRPRTMYNFGIRGVTTPQRVTRVSWRLDGSGLMTIATRAPEDL